MIFVISMATYGFIAEDKAEKRRKQQLEDERLKREQRR